MLEIELAGMQLGLLAQRAVYLTAERTLLVADAHVGKAASFRRLGVPVPRGTTAGTLERLDQALRLTGAERVIFLGDLLHSKHALAPGTLAAVADWRHRQRALELVLVRGNHDDRAGDPPATLGVRCVDEPLRCGPLALAHHPRAAADAYVLAGHLHPCVAVGGRAGERLRLPCFHFGAHGGVLPAFGEFTGMHTVRPAAGERVYVVAGDTVRALPLHTLGA